MQKNGDGQRHHGDFRSPRAGFPYRQPADDGGQDLDADAEPAVHQRLEVRPVPDQPDQEPGQEQPHDGGQQSRQPTKPAWPTRPAGLTGLTGCARCRALRLWPAVGSGPGVPSAISPSPLTGTLHCSGRVPRDFGILDSGLECLGCRPLLLLKFRIAKLLSALPRGSREAIQGRGSRSMACSAAAWMRSGSAPAWPRASTPRNTARIRAASRSGSA